MAGGYFDLPISSCSSSSSRPSNLPDASSDVTPPPAPPLSTPNDSFSSPNASTTAAGAAGAAQPRPRTLGILKSSNRVKFNVDDRDRDPAGQFDVKTTTAPHAQMSSPTASDDNNTIGVVRDVPRRPSPAARLPSMDRVPQYPLINVSPQESSSTVPSASTSASTSTSTPAPGIHVSSRSSSPGIVWDDEVHPEKGRAIHYARERAQRLASLLSRPSSRTYSATILSPRYSLPSSAASTPSYQPGTPSEYGEEIPMITLPEKPEPDHDRHSIDDDDDDDDDDGSRKRFPSNRTSEAHRLVRQMAHRDMTMLSHVRPPSPGLRSGQVTPIGERDPHMYVEPPTHYRGGILSSLLKLYDQPAAIGNGSGSGYDRGRNGNSRRSSYGDVASSSRGTSPEAGWRPQRPRKWYEKSPSQSTASLGSTSKGSSPIAMLKHSRSNSSLGNAAARRAKPQLEDEIRITVHIAEVLSRQKYILRLCRALIRFGAPTHRLEEYMVMTARVLELDMQCLYIPGCMIISFGDVSTHTTEMNLIRSAQGVDLGRMADVHEIYKEVIHDVIGVEEAIQRLDEVMKRRHRFAVWLQVLVHGCACASVGPFAFQARPIDLPIAFFLGCLVGIMQLVFSPRSNIYSNIFEISAAILTSFLSRAFGSISYHGQRLFCFSALAQSSIALILPGYVMLCASLELQSRNIVAGSVRLVYAIIYSLFLGFGITIGTALYGLLDTDATFQYTCPPAFPNEYVARFPFVILFTIFLGLVNHAKWKQLPVMITIALAGYVVNFFSSKRFSSYSQVSVPGALAAFIIGLLGNLYSRLRHGVAASAMLPAIFVLVPSGLASSGALVSGIASAAQLTRNSNHNPYTVITNGTQGFLDATSNMTEGQHSAVVLDIGYGMVQIAIAFTVGLFLAAMVVYPFGKKRSGLFSF